MQTKFSSIAEMEAEAEATNNEGLRQHASMNRQIKKLLATLDGVSNIEAVGASIGLFYNLLANQGAPKPQIYSMMHHLLDRFEAHFGSGEKSNEPVNH